MKQKWKRFKERVSIIRRLLSREYFMVFTWDETSEVFLNAHYRAYHKANPLLNDIIEAYWKQKYENEAADS